jgi:hypothetical protein
MCNTQLLAYPDRCGFKVVESDKDHWRFVQIGHMIEFTAFARRMVFGVGTATTCDKI